MCVCWNHLEKTLEFLKVESDYLIYILSSDNLRNEAGVWGIKLESQAIEYRHSLNHCQSIFINV